MSTVPSEPPAASPPRAWTRFVWPVGGALVFRFACVTVMIWFALWAEARPAPTLPDAVLAHMPYVESIDRMNYVIWLLAYLPVALALLLRDPLRFARYMVTAGWVALVRGLCIAATGLGPVHGPDINAGMDDATRADAFTQLSVPFSGLLHQVKPLYLTKDLFFSGHTSTTFCLLLYVWKFPRLRAWMIAGHLVVVATVFLAHLHYTIDVIGAYAITFAVFALREGNVKSWLEGVRA